jgi:hypothetical protein
MKNYQHWSTETLMRERERLLANIADWERTLGEVKSYLIVLSLTHSIRRTRERIHAIDAELCYRHCNKGE